MAIASPQFVIGGVCLRLTLDACGCGIIGLSLLAVGSIAWITVGLPLLDRHPVSGQLALGSPVV